MSTAPSEPHSHSHEHDINLKSAYIHVLADAATSVLAIIALTAGKLWGAAWLDPVMGIVGSAVISQWAYGLIRQTQIILLDKEPEDCDLNREIRKSIESDGDSVITDLHIWQVGSNKFAAIISLVAHQPKSPEAYKAPLKEHEELVHVTVEIHQCGGDHKKRRFHRVWDEIEQIGFLLFRGEAAIPNKSSGNLQQHPSKPWATLSWQVAWQPVAGKQFSEIRIGR